MRISPFFGIGKLDQIYELLDKTIGMRSYLPLYRGYCLDIAANDQAIRKMTKYPFSPSPNTNGAAQFSEIRRPQDEQSP